MNDIDFDKYSIEMLLLVSKISLKYRPNYISIYLSKLYQAYLAQFSLHE